MVFAGVFAVIGCRETDIPAYEKWLSRDNEARITGYSTVVVRSKFLHRGAGVG